MSSLYNLEPQPTAQVLLETTSGDILLELFAQQTPLASRNFLQLCIDGYYNGTIFHRLVPGFIVQGGDPTSTGAGGEAFYDGGIFDDEFHSRLKFNRRGLLGMANSGRKNDNGSQFFITLGPAAELEGKNTMFGRVVGDTIYNVMKMGDAELVGGEGERPLYPTKITGTEVLVNPFEGMVRREKEIRVFGGGERREEKKKGKKKSGKVLLSFGMEDGEEEEGTMALKKEKFNTKLVSSDNGIPSANKVNGSGREMKKTIENTTRRKRSRSKSPPIITRPDPQLQLPLPDNEEPSQSPSTSPEPAVVQKVSSLLERTNAQIADMKASMKRNIVPAPEAKYRKKSALEQMIPETATRGRKRKHGIKDDTPNDKQTLDILNAFRVKLEKAPPEIEPSKTPIQELASDSNVADDNGELEIKQEEEAELCDLHFIVNCQSCQSWDKHVFEITNADDDGGRGWMSHALNFDKDRLGKDLNWKKKNEEDLVVIDPREKTKEIMGERRAKKMAMSGGNTGRAWDRDRERGRIPERRAGEKE